MARSSFEFDGVNWFMFAGLNFVHELIFFYSTQINMKSPQIGRGRSETVRTYAHLWDEISKEFLEKKNLGDSTVGNFGLNLEFYGKFYVKGDIFRYKISSKI